MVRVVQVLKSVTEKVIEMNENRVNRDAIEASLEVDKSAAAAVHAELNEDDSVLNRYVKSLKCIHNQECSLGT